MAYFDCDLIKLVSVCTKGAIIKILQILTYESYKLLCYIISQKNSNTLFFRNKFTVKHTLNCTFLPNTHLYYYLIKLILIYKLLVIKFVILISFNINFLI